MPAPLDEPSASDEGATKWALTQLTLSPRLRQRRFQLLPVQGPSSPFTDLQGRLPGDSTAPVDLADLISSIAEVGVLQPVLVEETCSTDGAAPSMTLAAGERRLRAVRWGAVHMPDNPHFQQLPAVVCPGPLSQEERRIWQLIENLARTDLRPGELAAALLLHRCAVLVGKLLAAAIPVPANVYALDDPIARFRALEKIRGSNTACAAPWAEVLTRLGLQLSPRKARELVRAFAELPREISEEMDEVGIALHTRIRFAQLRTGRTQAAEDIWAAVRSRGKPELLPGAIDVATKTAVPVPECDDSVDGATVIVDVAQQLHDHANAARAAKLRRTCGAGGDAALDVEQHAEPQPDFDHQDRSAAPTASAADATRTDIAADLVADAFAALRALAAAVATGGALSPHDQASLRLLIDQITAAA